MAPELSSNWKKLQASLPSKKGGDASIKDSTSTKRRREEHTPRKRTGQQSTKKRKMSREFGSQKTSGKESTASLSLWAENNGVSSKDLADAYGNKEKPSTATVTKERTNEGFNKEAELGKYIALDCEMVGVGGEEDRSALARVSIVNFHGEQIYDSFVKPKEKVTDWRTHVSGISPQHMATARELEEVQKDVAQILEERILVGHSLKNDLDVLMLGHPRRDTRDTSKFSGFRKYSAGRAPSLKKLTKLLLGIDIQEGEHSSVQDARATMLLFQKHKHAIELEHAQHYPPTSRSGSGKSSNSKKKKKKSKR